MSGGRSGQNNNLVLVAGTILATVAFYRHFVRTDFERAVTTADAARSTSEMVRRLEVRSPEPFPARWRSILLRTYQRINEDRLMATAAGVVFYGLLAIFPAITAIVSSYALFADPSTISDNLHGLALMLPESSFAIVQDQIARVLAKGTSGLGVSFIIGLFIAIWSANAGMKALLDALNVAYERRETRSFIKLNLLSLGLTIATLGAILIMIGAVVVVPLLMQRSGFEDDFSLILRIGRWPLLTILLLLGLAILYRYGPAPTNARWQLFSTGALMASALWLICSAIFSWYLSDFGNYTATYGSLGAAIGLMMWMWMSAIIVLSGAELNSEIESQRLPRTNVQLRTES
jgi:membrane protein